MYKVGDYAKIYYHGMDKIQPGSPADNLEGSIIQITEVTEYRNRTIYHFRIVEGHYKNKVRFEKYQCTLAWEDEHFIPVEPDMEIDTLSLFS